MKTFFSVLLVITAGAAVAILSGCPSISRIHTVAVSAPGIVTSEGILYRIPKTYVTASVQYDLWVEDPLPAEDKKQMEDFIRQLASDKDAASLRQAKSAELKEKSRRRGYLLPSDGPDSVKITIAQLPSDDQLYQVRSFDSAWMATSNYKIELTADGYLQTVNATYDDKRAEVATNLVSSAISIAKIVAKSTENQPLRPVKKTTRKFTFTATFPADDARLRATQSITLSKFARRGSGTAAPSPQLINDILQPSTSTPGLTPNPEAPSPPIVGSGGVPAQVPPATPVQPSRIDAPAPSPMLDDMMQNVAGVQLFSTDFNRLFSVVPDDVEFQFSPFEWGNKNVPDIRLAFSGLPDGVASVQKSINVVQSIHEALPAKQKTVEGVPGVVFCTPVKAFATLSIDLTEVARQPADVYQYGRYGYKDVRGRAFSTRTENLSFTQGSLTKHEKSASSSAAGATKMIKDETDRIQQAYDSLATTRRTAESSEITRNRSLAEKEIDLAATERKITAKQAEIDTTTDEARRRTLQDELDTLLKQQARLKWDIHALRQGYTPAS